MKTKAIVAVLLCVMGLATIGIGNSEAAGGWFTCNVLSAGVGGGNAFIVLSDAAPTNPAFTNAWFLVDPSTNQVNAYVATALTAISNSKTAWCYVTDTVSWSTVASIYVNN